VLVLNLMLIGLAVALDPLPLTAFLIVLSSKRGTIKGAAFVFGWPRALDLTWPTAADARALTLLAREQECIPAARVEFHLTAPGSLPTSGGTPTAGDGPGNAATPVRLSSSAVPAVTIWTWITARPTGLQRIRTAYPIAAGVAAHEKHASLAAGGRRCRWPVCEQCQPPAEVLSWRQDSERHPLSAS
jgi:hypothetical protein